MKTLTITEGKTNLSAIVEKVVTTGTPVVMGRNGKPMVKIIPYNPIQKNQRVGKYEGQILLDDNFDNWDEEEAKSFGMFD